MDDIISKNRRTISSVENFITSKDYEESADQYGLPRHVRHLIDKPINRDITYVDLLMFLSKFLDKKEINYLELGVSVLKTFFQVASYLENSNIYAYDINYINPTIENRFVKNEDKQILFDEKYYNYNSNNITYFKGDVFDVDSLNNFQNNVLQNKLDIIFSDAHHSYNGLMSEYNNLLVNVLNDDFILNYDDLQFTNNPTFNTVTMNDAFFTIAKKFREKNPNIYVALVMVNGWLGQHEHKHANGIITTLNIREIFKINNININVVYFS